MIYVICLISKRRSSLGQTLTKIKHKVKWMGNQNIKFNPLLPRAFLPQYN